VFMWLGPLAGFLKFGTDGYPRAVQRRLRIVNAMALLIAVFSVIYAAVFAYYDAEHYRHLIVVNLLLAVIVLLVPLAHRINDIAAAVLIAIVEYVALFFFVRACSVTSRGFRSTTSLPRRSRLQFTACRISA